MAEPGIQQLIERFAAKDAEVALDRERDRLTVDTRDSDVDDGDMAINRAKSVIMMLPTVPIYWKLT